MHRFFSFFAVACLTLAAGCGGSSSGGNGGSDDSSAVYIAQLPGGAEMELVMADTSNGYWSGAIEEASPIEAENLDGMFLGKRTGDSVTAQCTFNNGTNFTLTGSYMSDKSLHLRRSDLPGVDLIFTAAIQNPSPATRSTVQFKFKGSTGASMIITVNTTPISQDAKFINYSAMVGGATNTKIVVNKQNPHVLIYFFMPGNSGALMSSQAVGSLFELTQRTVTSTSGFGCVWAYSFQTDGATTFPL
jgi:hypothetical protein